MSATRIAALIMHQHKLGVCICGNIIGVEILNLEVIDGNGCFKQLMLNQFDNDIFAVAGNDDISRTELRGFGPALMEFPQLLQAKLCLTAVA